MSVEWPSIIKYNPRPFKITAEDLRKSKKPFTIISCAVVKFSEDVDPNILDKGIKFAQKRADEQRKKATQEFNQNIQKFMIELGFKEFRDVALNNEYRLYIERLDTKTGRYVFQQVKTLSTSEKLAIAIVLQMALKETYLPDIPFMLIDDVISDFDDDSIPYVELKKEME